MAIITFLPTEILLQIFSGLQSGDHAALRKTCRLFRIVKPPPQISRYNFEVDRPSQLDYKLIRALLLNPSIGERFEKIAVTWSRRLQKDIRSLRQLRRTSWEWTPNEIVKIKEVGEKWKLTTRTIEAIIAGIDSEALLPLLLCYTVNLETLLMGDMEPWPAYDLGNKYSHFEGPTLDSGAWFHENLHGPDDWLPGLANIRYFSQSWKKGSNAKLGINARYIWPIFFLPRIDMIVLKDCTTLPSRSSDKGKQTTSIDSIMAGYQGLKSTVTWLEFRGNALNTEDYIKIAEITSSLEYLYIYDGENRGQKVELNEIRNGFRKHNTTLTERSTNVRGYN
ncbi:hypothetical protein ABW20_dc0100866 [Dactylellina cionopaga]|nr:hypothetical protein ABW20_dc0100866 [Dactylellina cionopaga]